MVCSSSRLRKRIRGLADFVIARSRRRRSNPAFIAAFWIASLTLTMTIFAPQAHAACANPAGTAGDFTFNSTHNVPQYCDNTNWIAMVGAEPTYNAPTNGLILYWKMDETSGTFTDYSSGGHTGTQNGGITYGATGKVGTAISFDGVDDYISNSNTTNDFTITSPWTINCWVYTTTTAMDTAPACSINKLSTNDRIGIGTDTGGTKIKIISNGETAGQGGTFTTSAWHMFTMTYDGTQISAWLDGQYSYSVTPSGSNWQSATDFTVAHNGFTSNSYDFWNGLVDEARLYNRELSAIEIQSLYELKSNQTQIVPSGLVGHWKLDETTGTDVIDYASSNNGSFKLKSGSTTPVNSVPGVVGTALLFDGSGSNQTAVYLPDDAYDTMSEGSITAWINWDGTSGFEGIFTMGPGGRGFELGTSDDGKIEMWTNTGPGCADTLRYKTNGRPITPNTWHHVAYTVDGTGNKIYIDGVQYTDISNPGMASKQIFFSTCADAGATTNYYIGRTEAGGEYFKGNIDDVRLYNRALSDSEVEEIYEARDGIRYNPNHRSMEFFDQNQWVSMTPDFPDITAGLSAHWKLDEITYTSASDSISGHDGDLQGGLDPVNDSVYGAVPGTAYDFDGMDDYILVNSVGLNLSSSDAFTVTAWINPRSFGELDEGNIFSQCNAAGSGTEKQLRIHNAGAPLASLRGFVDSDPGGSSSSFSQAGVISLNQWQLVAMSFDVNGDKKAHLYVNGAEVPGYDTQTVNGSGTSTGGSAGSDYIIGTDSNSGCWDGSGANRTFDGAIDDVRMYNRVLSTKELQKLYQMGAPVGKTTALPQGCPSIGDICDDGTVYAGLSPDGNVAMFTTQNDISGLKYWNSGNSTGRTSTGTTDLNTGGANTNTIVTVDSDSVTSGFQTHDATQACYDLVSNGADDWYLPAQNELNLMYTSQNLIGNFSLDLSGSFDTYYWSSTQDTTNHGRSIRFADGAVIGEFKDRLMAVRCVRKGPAPRCANPYGMEGDMVYNTTYNVIQYCDGARWIAIGKNN